MKPTVLIIILMSFLGFSCKDLLSDKGNLEVTFSPHINSDIEGSSKWYLFTADVGTVNVDPLVKGGYAYDDRSRYVEGKTVVFLKDLNAGNYIFRYYRDTLIKDHTVQVVRGKTKSYELKLK